jgi:hypothetical protein
VTGKAPVKRNRFIALHGADKSVNRTLEAKTRALAGWKGYSTKLTTCPDGTQSGLPKIMSTRESVSGG